MSRMHFVFFLVKQRHAAIHLAILAFATLYYTFTYSKHNMEWRRFWVTWINILLLRSTLRYNSGVK